LHDVITILGTHLSVYSGANEFTAFPEKLNEDRTMSTSRTVLATLVLLGSAPLAQAQGFGPDGQQRANSFQSRSVSSPRQAYDPAQDAWMNRASRSFSGGGY
jgi:hypothetical protein